MNIIKKQAEDKKLSREIKREILELLLRHTQYFEKSGIETEETSQGFTEEMNFTINNN